MRPRPSEIIAGIRTILAETVAPELTSDHARSRLAEVRAVLAQVDWDNAGFVLESKATLLADRLAHAARWVDDPLPEAPTERSFDAYQSYWEQLGALAVTALDRLTSHLDENPDDAAARAAFELLLDLDF